MKISHLAPSALLLLLPMTLATQITITPTPVQAALAPRQTSQNALSELVSEAITFGNSILSEMMSSTTTTSSSSSSSSSTSSATSSSFTSSSATSTSSLTTSTPSATSAASTSTPLPTTTPSTSHANIGLIIGLAVGLSILGAVLLLGLLYLCLRRRRKTRTTSHATSDSREPWNESTEYIRSHLSDGDNHPYGGVSVPPPIMAERSRARPDYRTYEPMSPVLSNSQPHSNPFLGPDERPGPLVVPYVSEPSSWQSAESHPRSHENVPSHRSSSPQEMFAEVPSSRTLVNGQKRGHNHNQLEELAKGASAIWPSRKEANNFDFGLHGEDSELAEPGIPQRKSEEGFLIPRRPISGQPTAL